MLMGNVFIILVSIHLSLLLSCVTGAVTRTGKPIPESWGGLRHKLNQILDSESREMGILQNLLVEAESENPSSDSADIINTESGKSSSSSVSVDERESETKSKLLNEQDKDKKVLVSATSDSITTLRENGIIKKLDDNSKRMDSMVVFLADLRNVLSEAITSQSKQMNFESEAVELREEIEYLRKEIQILKKEQALSSLNRRPALENKIQNDETTIQWLKESSKELRTQINDMAKSCNTTALLQMKQTLEQQSQRQQSDLLVVQRQIEAIQVQQLRQDEQIVEAKGNIEDVRSWQKNMGQKFIDAQTTFSENNVNSNEVHENQIFAEEQHFLTEAFKESTLTTTPTRHNKKLKAKLREIVKTAKQLAEDHYRFHKRLVKIENSQKVITGVVGNMKQDLSSDSTLSLGVEKALGLEKRISGVEHTISEYTMTLQNIGERVNVLNELQESVSQLFNTLEGLETRYDERLTEMQTTLAKMEASVSSITNSNEDLKEQQTYQSGIIQNVKKDILEAKGKLQTNHLRLASIQSQLLKWSSQKCSNENSESIQNIRISSLESLIQMSKSTQPEI